MTGYRQCCGEIVIIPQMYLDSWVIENTEWKKLSGVRPLFSTNPTFENPLKNPNSYLVEAGF